MLLYKSNIPTWVYKGRKVKGGLYEKVSFFYTIDKVKKFFFTDVCFVVLLLFFWVDHLRHGSRVSVALGPT